MVDHRPDGNQRRPARASAMHSVARTAAFGGQYLRFAVAHAPSMLPRSGRCRTPKSGRAMGMAALSEVVGDGLCGSLCSDDARELGRVASSGQASWSASRAAAISSAPPGSLVPSRSVMRRMYSSARGIREGSTLRRHSAMKRRPRTEALGRGDLLCHPAQREQERLDEHRAEHDVAHGGLGRLRRHAGDLGAGDPLDGVEVDGHDVVRHG